MASHVLLYSALMVCQITECKHSQDAEDIFPVQQHFYPSFPFVSPFFYNSPFTNLYCPHNPAPEPPAKEQQQQPGHEPGNVSHQKEKSFRAEDGTEEKDAPKNSNVPGPEAMCHGHPWCFLNANSPASPGSGRCGCGDSLPWACNSFIVPMITYCVIWNSRKSNVSTANSPEACQQNKVGEPDTSTDLPAASQTNNNPTQIEDECLEVEEVTNMEWRHQVGVEDIDRVTTRSFKSLTSSFDKESGYDNTEDNSDKNELHMEGGSDDSEDDEEEEEDNETDDWPDEDKNDQEETTNIHFPNELQSLIKPFDSQTPSATGSYTDLKQLEKSKTPTAGGSCTDLKANTPDSIGEGEKAFCFRTTNHSVQEKIDRQKTHIREGMCTKKFINNFTMTDQTNCTPEEAQSSTAAAGDLGGVNCIGYRINITHCFDGREFEILKGMQTVQNTNSKEDDYVKDESHTEEEHNSTKISDKTTKNVKHFKSGIAKLLNTPKLKDSKADPGKNTKTDTRKQVQREPAVGKPKHHCLSVATTTGTADSSKAQKMRNHRLTQDGPEKQIKTKSETLKKEEKNSRAKTTKDVVKK